ncbi:MAG TPA: FadR/GntR family transcriptional regulator [Armatimonadota bacterium]|nr:FadR/GntR family transcriptional regulator [Armatimonadota bacterium]
MADTANRKSLSSEVLQNLRRHILDNGLKPGDRLPTERELAAALSVSRTTVREALQTLEGIGALERRPRIGSVLRSVDFGSVAAVSQFLMVRTADDLRDLFVARRLLEVSVLPLVARTASAEQYRQMEEANRQMEAEIEAEGVSTAGDAAFHRALLAAANNNILTQLGGLVQEFFSDPRTRLHVDAATARHSLVEHCRIVTALQNEDITQAQQLMEKHLSTYEQRGVLPPLCEPSEGDTGK